jgi:hypothetical protein
VRDPKCAVRTNSEMLLARDHEYKRRIGRGCSSERSEEVERSRECDGIVFE